MKILSLHCDYLKYKPLKKAVKKPEELDEERKKEIEVKEPLGIFVAVEKADESNPDMASDELVKNVMDLIDKTKAKKVVLYPYAHLSSDLANPDVALLVLVEAETKLKEKNIEVYRAPFGYYKEFELKCKGHPLSELSNCIKNKSGKIMIIGVAISTLLDSFLRYKLSVSLISMSGLIVFPTSYFISQIKYKEKITTQMWVGTIFIIFSKPTISFNLLLSCK
jgi:hypothetical protein